MFSAQITGDPTITISSYLLIVGGSALSLTSFAMLYTERSNEANSLKQREEDLNQIMERLKKKFLNREIPEEDMRKLNTDIVRELAEIEVKLDKLNKRPSKN
jgi:threonine synthase